MAQVKQAVDKFNMRQVILDFSSQFGAGLKSAEAVGIKNGFDGLLVCGMGGSALPGDVLKMWLRELNTNFPVQVHRDYGLPKLPGKNPLLIFISYSGNTEETLSSLKEAEEKHVNIVAIASGGKLEELCRKKSIPLAKVPAGLQPRMALGYQFSALAKILENCGIVSKDSLGEIEELEKVLEIKSIEAAGKKLAKRIKGGIPLIYASLAKKELARIWKIKFNENSKIPAFYNYFPELNHNEMTGFNNAKPFSIIFLRDPADNKRNLRRMELTAEILSKKGAKTNIVNLEGESFLSKIFSSIILADWASYYLALEYGIDPTPVKIVEEFKEKLK